MPYLFIVNPTAGNNKADKIISIINEVMDSNNCDYRIKVTKKTGDGQRFAQEAKAAGYFAVVSVGGDGTLHEIVNGMEGGTQKLGIIPAGTGNDFARSLNIPFNIRDAVEVLVHRNAALVDLGKLNNRYFANFCSVGLDALVVEEANKIKKHLPGTYSYIVGVFRALGKFKSQKVEFIIDNTKYNEEIMLIAICNGGYYGGGMNIAPNADISDGQFDICVVRKLSKPRLLFLFPSIFRGKHTKYEEVKIYRGKNVQVFFKEGMSINSDGVKIKGESVRAEILHKKMEVLVDI